MSVKEMTTAHLVFATERLVGRTQRCIEATPEKRHKPSKDGLSLESSVVIFLPLAVIMLRELRDRGIPTGYEYIIEEYDALVG